MAYEEEIRRYELQGLAKLITVNLVGLCQRIFVSFRFFHQ